MAANGDCRAERYEMRRERCATRAHRSIQGLGVYLQYNGNCSCFCDYRRITLAAGWRLDQKRTREDSGKLTGILQQQIKGNVTVVKDQEGGRKRGAGVEYTIQSRLAPPCLTHCLTITGTQSFVARLIPQAELLLVLRHLLTHRCMTSP